MQKNKKDKAEEVQIKHKENNGRKRRKEEKIAKRKKEKNKAFKIKVIILQGCHKQNMAFYWF